MLKRPSVFSIIRLILLIGLLSLFFGCSNTPSGEGSSLQGFKEKEGDSKTSATEKLWSIPEPYTNLSIEEIKAVKKVDKLAKCSYMHTVKSKESIS